MIGILRLVKKPSHSVIICERYVSRIRPYSTHEEGSRKIQATGDSLQDRNRPYLNPVLAQPRTSEIREQLRLWEIENASTYGTWQDRYVEVSSWGVVNTSISQPPSDADLAEENAPGSPFGSQDLLDVGDQRTFLLPGDLVEIHNGGMSPQLGLYLREVGLPGTGAFYMMDGRLSVRSTIQAIFSVPGFVDPTDIAAVVKLIPNLEVITNEDLEVVHVDIGAPLLKKLRAFWSGADTIYRKFASVLEDAHQSLAHPTRFTYYTLEEITDRLISSKRSEQEMHCPQTLYAVHRALMLDDVALRPLSQASLRDRGEYEISPLSEVTDLRKVKAYVRNYQYIEGKKQQGVSGTSKLHLFALKCQKLIDASRRYRSFTTFGMTGPGSITGDPSPGLTAPTTFNEDDKTFIRFLKTWAVTMLVGEYSHANGFASSIIRAIGRYPDLNMDSRLGWTFLEEIGVLKPWDTRAPYRLRLFNMNTAITSSGFREDTLQDLRKDWESLPAYCVDDVHAHELDDAISVEPSDNTDEYWVHVHAADPASHLDPKSDTAKHAESMATTVYTPDDVYPMLPSDFVQAKLSLAANRPCLTFSVRVNLKGDLLETRIIPGIIRDIKFITPAILEQAVTGKVPCDTSDIYSIGPRITPGPIRKMHGIRDLSALDKSNLVMLHNISDALVQKSFRNGGITIRNADVSLSVCSADKTNKPSPSIKLRISHSNSESSTIKYLMLLAGQAAARWCNDRGIPIPYRVTPRNPATPDPSEYYHKVVVPNVKNLSIDIALHYLSLIGGVVASSTPGPHMTLGADMIARCTSPLRRFGDLLLHWQVESALLEEARTGKSLVGNKSDHFLPFSKNKLDTMIRRMSHRERFVKKGESAALQEWLCHFLVRVWKFNEGTLPSPLRFRVRRIYKDVQRVTGQLAEIPTSASLLIDGSLEFNTIQVGDQFEVELDDIDVRQGKITVKPVRRTAVPTGTFDYFPIQLNA